MLFPTKVNPVWFAALTPFTFAVALSKVIPPKLVVAFVFVIADVPEALTPLAVIVFVPFVTRLPPETVIALFKVIAELAGVAVLLSVNVEPFPTLAEVAEIEPP